MSILPDSRSGKLLKIKKRLLEFTLWPTKKGTRRHGLQSRVFVSDPWVIIKHSIENKCPGHSKPQALAFCDQAQDYFKAAKFSSTVAAKPVLLYYCYLNFAKAFVLTKRGQTEYGSAYHGLKERYRPTGVDLYDAYLEATPSGKHVNVFDDFFKIINLSGLSSVVQYEIKYLLPQILQGHRLWCSASDSKERFIEIEKIEILQNSSEKHIWLAFYVYEDDLTRLDMSRKRLLEMSRLSTQFQEVKHSEMIAGRRLLKFEQLVPIDYTHRPSDKIKELISHIKNNIWINLYSVPPYKTFYLYCSPVSEHPFVLPQLTSIFSTMYYFGSVTRYNPHQFNEFLSNEQGVFIQEFIANTPDQFLFLMASEFSEQEVTRAASI